VVQQELLWHLYSQQKVMALMNPSPAMTLLRVVEPIDVSSYAGDSTFSTLIFLEGIRVQ